MAETDTTNRRLGALYGAVVGDTLGVTYEFKVPHEIPAPPYEIVGGGPFDFAPGEGSDDSDLLIAAMRSYRTVSQFDPDLMVEHMLDWYAKGPKDIGRTTAESLCDWANRRVPVRDDDAQGNGGLMRAMAHGIMCESAQSAADNASEDTFLTHPSSVTAGCSSEYAALLSHLIAGRTYTEVRDVVSIASYTIPHYKRGGHCIHSMRLALWALENAKYGFEKVMNAVISTGGDTDTNATIAGALLGAERGFHDIPKRWIDALNVRGLDEQVRRIREKEIIVE